MAGFDPHDKNSWFFGIMSKEEANKIFANITEDGVFLVRESARSKGDCVLCVKEGPKISHYKLSKIDHGNKSVFKIGEHTFPDLPAMLEYFQTHYLDKTPLTKPAPREKVLARYDFPGQSANELPFRKSEVLEVITKDEIRWWTARNSVGKIGQIPVMYVTEYDGRSDSVVGSRRSSRRSSETLQQECPHVNKSLPAKAKVIRSRIATPLDEFQMTLNEGETVTVTQINPDGKWWGCIGNRQGYFPFTHVKFLED